LKKVNLPEIVEKGISQGIKSISIFKRLPVLGNNRNIIKLSDIIFGSEEIRSVLITTTKAWQYETFEGVQVYSSIELGKEYVIHTMEQNPNDLLSRKIIKWENAYAVASMGDYLKHQGAGNNK